MGEASAAFVQNVKEAFKTKVVAQSEIQGGTWDSKTNTYTRKDPQSGITTEYAMKKNKRYETGYEVKVKSFKDLPDAKTGELKKTEVVFDPKKNEWTKKTTAMKAREFLTPQQKFMATLNEVTTGTGEPTFTLKLQAAKYRQEGHVIPVVIPAR